MGRALHLLLFSAWIYGATGCEWGIDTIVVNEISLEQQSMMRGTFAYLLYVLRPTVHQKSFVFGALIWWAPFGRGGMVINWYQLIQSQESIQIIILCINFIELLEWFKGTSLTSPESLNYDTFVGASFHDTRQTASLHCEALCRPCFDISFRKNGFIVGIQENSSSSNSPATQFTPESLNCDTVVGASFHDTKQTASLNSEALCKPCFDISFRKTVSSLAFKRILPALTLHQSNSHKMNGCLK